jgi:hypothetical protein
MAGDWIKMSTGLRRHPKVVRMASALKADRLRVVGGLHAVWSIFDEQSPDGVLEGYTAAIMDEEIGWKGFTAAMTAIGWMEVMPDGLQAPRFDEHNGQSAKRRAMETQRKREARSSAPDPENVGAQSGQMSASDADKLRSREEKRREEEYTPPAVVARATRKCPPGFEVTPELGQWAAANAPLIDIQSATDRFRDHTFKTAISDWPGAWRNWLRRDQEAANTRRPFVATRQSAQAKTINDLTGGLASPKDSHALTLA